MSDRVAFVIRDNAALGAYLDSLTGVSITEIGHSRAGQALYGLTMGSGPVAVSVIAGCHADEPAGPATAQALPLLLRGTRWLERCTFSIVPQMNPDGADANRPWFSNPPDLARYAEKTVRELPGDDIEFGFGGDAQTRPENRAAMGFLASRGPFRAHFSLHGMGFAEGGWYLLCREWAERAAPLMDRLADRTAAMGFPLHDIDRQGEKGFTRLRPGFCTTPTHTAMRACFHDDPEMAARFQPSSMEFMQGLGGDPLCMVSELPLFRIGRRSPSLDESIYWAVIERFKALRRGCSVDPEGLAAFRADFEIEAAPLDLQCALQFAMIEEALSLVAWDD